jgi:hypothetical protein
MTSKVYEIVTDKIITASVSGIHHGRAIVSKANSYLLPSKLPNYVHHLLKLWLACSPTMD